MTCKQCGYYMREQSDHIPVNDGIKRRGYFAREQSEQTGQPQVGYTSQQTSQQQTGYTSQQTAQQQTGYTSQQTTRPQTGYTSQQTSQQQAGYTSQQAGYTSQQSAYTPQQASGTPYTSANQTGQQFSPLTPPQSKPDNTGVIIGVVVGIIFLVVVGISVVLVGAFSFLRNTSDQVRMPEINTDEATIIDPTAAPDRSNSKYNDYISSFRKPHSDFFYELAEVIFDKPMADITDEEFASLTALQIDMDDKDIYYSINYEMGTPLYFEEGIEIDYSDLSSFPGLEWISLEGDEFKAGDLDGLAYLYGVYSDNTLDELIKIIPDPENITELGFEASFLDHDLSKLEHFPNLEYLYMEGERMTDISALKNYPNLKGLAMFDFNSLMDYSPLMSLTALEELTIHSKQMKTMDFIKVMPNLTYLEIEGSQITEISALSACPELTTLTLVKNYSVSDYTPVGELVNLTDLTIHKDTHAVMPSLKKLTYLEQASFTNLWEEELPLITAASNIYSLYLENCYDDNNLEALTALPLTSLSLVDSSISGKQMLEPLTRLPLEYLDLSESYMFGNMEEVFGIPTLQYLYLDKATGVIDFDKVPYNDNLVVLSMNGLRINPEAYNNTERINLSSHYDFFDHFPNLENLQLAGMKIDNIEFVENLPQLVYLDITNNNVTSLKPLENLSYFRKVLCGQNTILEWMSEDSGIEVDSESYYSGY